MKYQKYIITAGLLIAAFSIGRFSSPQKVEVREVERVVYREIKSTDRNQNYVEVKRETRSPDGTVVTETRKEKETSTQTRTDTGSETEKSRSKVVTSRPSYRIAGMYEPAIKGLQENSYAVILEKRIISELYVGVSVSSNKTIGITFSLGF